MHQSISLFVCAVLCAALWGSGMMKSRAETLNGGNQEEKDNKKTNVCQHKHAFACQSIPL